MQLGGTRKSYAKMEALYPVQMRELLELFRELQIPGGKHGRAARNRATLQAMQGFPMLKRKAELLEMVRMDKARKTAGAVMTLLFPPVAPPKELEQAKEVAQKETIKKVVPWALASAAAGLLYFVL